MLKTCVVTYGSTELTETFILAHVEHLEGEAELLAMKTHELLSRTPLQRSPFYRLGRKIARETGLSSISSERTRAYRTLFGKMQPDIVLAEYGPTAARVVDACLAENLPLVAHFHGYDASRHTTIEKYREGYQRVFEKATAIVAVSRPMRNKLIDMGAPPERVFWNPCGAECSLFKQATFDSPEPVFVSVGRFVPKKGHHLTLLAFAHVLKAHPEARLRMIGDEFLLDACRDLAQALQIDHAVAFLGARPHEAVREEMQRAWCYVQHSIEAHSGDSEGTPVAVMEAGAAGLPVVSTWHAGIPDVILDGKTGFLVQERDVDAMADRMIQIAGDKHLAQKLGEANRRRVCKYFDVRDRVSRLSRIVEWAAGRAKQPVPVVPDWLEKSNGQVNEVARELTSE